MTHVLDNDSPTPESPGIKAPEEGEEGKPTIPLGVLGDRTCVVLLLGGLLRARNRAEGLSRRKGPKLAFGGGVPWEVVVPVVWPHPKWQ